MNTQQHKLLLTFTNEEQQTLLNNAAQQLDVLREFLTKLPSNRPKNRHFGVDLGSYGEIFLCSALNKKNLATDSFSKNGQRIRALIEAFCPRNDKTCHKQGYVIFPGTVHGVNRRIHLLRRLIKALREIQS
jgi:hypothetical protein